MFLPLAEKSIHDLMTQARIKFSDSERKILKPRKKNKGEGIFIYADKRVHLLIEPTEVEWELMGGKPKEGKRDEYEGKTPCGFSEDILVVSRNDFQFLSFD